MGRTLRGKTLGIYGYGRIGQVVAGYGPAFGMDILVWDATGVPRGARADGMARRESGQFFAACDVISLHLRLVPATRGIVSPPDLAEMRPTHSW